MSQPIAVLERALSDGNSGFESEPGPPVPGPTYAGVRFLPVEERKAWGVGVEGVLVVRLDRVGPSARGRLADVIDEAIERELAARGATSPGIGSASNADAALSDQLFRARQLGIRTLALAFGSLRGAASPRGALEADDSATLIFWARATEERPVALVLDEGDRQLGSFVEPIPLSEAVFASTSTSTSTSNTTLASSTTSILTSTTTTPPVATDLRSHYAGAAVATADETWRTWVLSLTAARGPQPLAAFEHLFTQSYLPLSNAVAAGLDDPRARAAADDFRRNFARVYTDACPTFAVTGKRPRMVLDAPEVAARIARLHGARTTQLLLVDGMRYDLGCFVKTALARSLGSHGSLTDETILWSALPTHTARQLETLTRGSDSLRDCSPREREQEPMRGRTAETIRRLKIGSRDVFKLDLAEAHLREATTHALAALSPIGEAVAEVVARHAGTLAARTLLFVFGDHGFTIEPGGATRHGGASPEEVLVPGYAFLIGEVH
jgi:hypothetical protein